MEVSGNKAAQAVLRLGMSIRCTVPDRIAAIPGGEPATRHPPPACRRKAKTIRDEPACPGVSWRVFGGESVAVFWAAADIK